MPLKRIETGIIDPTKVVRVALDNAVSVSSVLLLTEATLTEVPETQSEHAASLEQMPVLFIEMKGETMP